MLLDHFAALEFGSYKYDQKLPVIMPSYAQIPSADGAGTPSAPLEFEKNKDWSVSETLFSPRPIVILCCVCMLWDFFYITIHEEVNLRDLNLYVWTPTEIVLVGMMSLGCSFGVCPVSRNQQIGLISSILLVHITGHFVISDPQPNFSTGVSYSTSIGMYAVFTYFLIDILCIPKKLKGLVDRDIIIQLVITTFYACVAGLHFLEHNGMKSLSLRNKIFLLILGIAYKLVWLKMLYRMYLTNQRERLKKSFLPLGLRKWHGHIVRIGNESKLLQSWNSMWESTITHFESDNFSVARVHLDPYLRQHVSLTFNGVYAIRIAPTSELSYFRHVLPNSELETMIPRDSDDCCFQATLVFGKNERDCIGAKSVTRVEGRLILENREYYFSPNDGKMNIFWANKSRPHTIHLIAISPGLNKIPIGDVFKTKFQDEPDLDTREWLQLNIFENLKHEQVSFWSPRMLKQRFVYVLKKFNTKVKARAIERKMVELAEIEMAYSFSSVIQYFLPDSDCNNFKREVQFDWCGEHDYERLHDLFFAGEIPANAIIFIDSLDYSPRSRILNQQGRHFRVGEMGFTDNQMYLIHDLRLI